MLLPKPIQNLIDAFSRLPGVGPKTASRLTFYLLRANDADTLEKDLAAALLALKPETKLCSVCFNITTSDRETCEICLSAERRGEQICVVEDPLDVLALEKTGGFLGHYHVLHGAISPIEGITAEDIKISELLERLRHDDVKEVIMANNPSMEGDITAKYLRSKIKPLGIRVTQLAHGLPVGGDLEYADQNTLLRALAGRQNMD